MTGMTALPHDSVECKMYRSNEPCDSRCDCKCHPEVASLQCSECPRCVHHEDTPCSCECHRIVASEAQPELVNNPLHYGGPDNPHEHVKCMEAIGLDHDAYLYTCTKYIWRAGRKKIIGKSQLESSLQDLEKAAWYLNRRIQQLKRDR
jgi:hypothetical protein